MKPTQEQSIILARAYRAGYEAGRESMEVDSIHTCHDQCQRPACVAVREAYEAGRKDENEACAKVAESYEPRCDSCPSGVANAIRARREQ